MRCLSRTIPLAMLATAALLSGCGKADNDPGPGGVSMGEARALDEAAEMIESRRPVEEAPDTQAERPDKPAAG
ncbi:MAG: hypothetical protein PHE36_00505 [Novosphingobium sp.]|nr:hypothetical protein [Novosphingobium sp.]